MKIVVLLLSVYVQDRRRKKKLREISMSREPAMTLWLNRQKVAATGAARNGMREDMLALTT